jgi:hypothetical protein
MMDTKIAWKAVDVPHAASITGVRWVSGREGPVLVASSVLSGPQSRMDSTLVFSNVSARAELLKLPQSVPSIPDWDVSSDKDDRLTFVYTDAGGAINALMLQRPQTGAIAVSTGTPFESYHRPRFIKHAAGSPVLAIQGEDQAIAIAFTDLGAGGYSNHHLLPRCESALAIAGGNGYQLFYKSALPGPPRGNLIARGMLHLAGLDHGFKSSVAPSKPLGDVVVFEYDVERLRDRLAILATTASGTVLKIGEAMHAFDEANPEAMTSPSMLASGGKIYLAALQGAMTNSARVLVAYLPE